MTFKNVLSAALASAALLTGSAAFAQQSSPPPAGSPMMKPSGMDAMAGDRFGGPTYSGAPDLDVTSALVTAGGGAASFSTAKALTTIVGPTLTNAEVAKLTTQFGKADTDSWITVFDFAVQDAAKIATAAGVSFPTPPADLSGKKLAGAIVAAGVTAPDNRFWTGYMLDALVTHKIHNQVMDDIDKKYGAKADLNYHVVTNQAMYDLAQALNG